MTADTRIRSAGTAQAVPLLLASCMAVLGAVLLTPVIPQLLDEFGGSPLVLLIISAPALMIAVFAPFAGQLADRIGRKQLLIVTMFVYAIVGTAPTWLPAELSLILISRLLVGVCEAAIMTCCTTLLGDYFSGYRRNRYFGLQSVFTTISATVFLLVGGLVGAAGWRTPFFVYAISLVIVIPMFFTLWEPRKAVRSVLAQARIPWRMLALPLVVSFFGGFVFFVVVAEPPVIYATLGLSDAQTIGPLSAAASVATAILAFLFARLAKLGVRILLPLAFTLIGIGYLIVWIAAQASTLPGVVAGVLVASAGSGLLLPTLIAWAVGRIPFASRGRSTGVWTASFFFGQFITPLVFAAIQGATGTGVAVAVGGVGVVSVVVALALAVALPTGPIVAESVEEEGALVAA